MDTSKIFANVETALLKAAEEIIGHLEGNDDFKKKFKFRRGNTLCGKASQGKFGYKNYIGVCVKDINNDDKIWEIALYYNDVDKNGNCHTQFGKIQFWKDIKNTSPISVHEPVSSKDGDMVVKLCFSKAYNPKQAIYDETYNPKKLIDDFIKWANVT